MESISTYRSRSNVYGITHCIVKSCIALSQLEKHIIIIIIAFSRRFTFFHPTLCKYYGELAISFYALFVFTILSSVPFYARVGVYYAYCITENEQRAIDRSGKSTSWNNKSCHEHTNNTKEKTRMKMLNEYIILCQEEIERI